MAILTIRDLPEEAYDRLRIRAAQNRRSMEAEARAILIEAERAPQPKRGAMSPEEAMRKLEEMWKWVKPKEGFETLTGEFLAERRAMWGEDD